MKGIIHTLTVIIVAGVYPGLLSQIEISGGDILELLGQSHRMEQRNGLPTTVTVGSSGADRIWDFRLLDVSGGSSHIQSYMSVEETPFEEEFPNSNLTIYNRIGGGDYYNYYQVSPDGLFDIGAVNLYSVQGTSYQDLYQGSFMLAPLPLAFGSTWNVVTKDTTDYETLLVINRDSTENIVDGWGTIRIPAGDFPCLRIKSRAILSEENIFNGESFITSDTVISYSWITKDAFIVLSMTSLNNEIEEQFTTAFTVSRLAQIDQSTSTRDIANSRNMSWSVYPNPFTDALKIELKVQEPGIHKVQLLDFNSRVLEDTGNRSLSTGTHLFEWKTTVAQLDPAVYFIRIITPGEVSVRSVIKSGGK